MGEVGFGELGRRSRGGDGALGGGRWFGSRVDGARALAFGGGADVFLGFGGVVAGVLFDGVGGGFGVLGGEVGDLGSLLVDDFVGVGEVVVDELLVGGVEEGTDVDGGGADEAEAPEGDDFDEVVGEEGGDAGEGGVGYVFGEDDALEFDDEEVDELFDIFEGGF